MNNTYTELLTQISRFSPLGAGVFTLSASDVTLMNEALQQVADFNTSIPDLADAKSRLLDVATDVKEGEDNLGRICDSELTEFPYVTLLRVCG